MSKVYIVTSGEYSDYGICAAFSTEELVGKYIEFKRNMDRWASDYRIEEYEMDLGAFSSRTIVGAVVYESGDVFFYNEPHKRERVDNTQRVFVNIHYADSRVMEKAARDRAAMIRARQEGI